MELPIRFPNEADEIYEEAQAFQRLSLYDRLKKIGELARAGQMLARDPEHRASIDGLRAEEHERFKQHLRELIDRHGQGRPD